jgi:hypothetical protein
MKIKTPLSAASGTYLNAGGDQNHGGHDGDGEQAGKLRTSARLLHHGGSGRTRIHREGAKKRRQNATGADTREVAGDVLIAVSFGRKRPHDGRRLNHANQRDEQGCGQQLSEVIPTR